MNSGLKRRATFEETLDLPGPNLDLPQRTSKASRPSGLSMNQPKNKMMKGRNRDAGMRM